MPKVKTLPPRMHLKHGAYYHVSTTQPRKWTRLSKQLGEALKAWASIEASPLPASNITFAGMANLYRLQVIPTLRDKTQIDYHRHLDRLTPVFEHLQLSHIKPSDVHQYCQLRGKTSKVQANREKAILSALFNFARRKAILIVRTRVQALKGIQRSHGCAMSLTKNFLKFMTFLSGLFRMQWTWLYCLANVPLTF
jgi:uncharacterized iron-regulated protein